MARFTVARFTVVVLVWLYLSSNVSLGISKRSPDAILKMIDDIVEPTAPDSKQGDPEATRAYLEKLHEYQDRVADLTGELSRADPENSRLITLLPKRWTSLARRGPTGLKEVVHETEQVIANAKNRTLRQDAAVWMLHIALKDRPDPAQVGVLVDRFLSIVLNSEHTADLLMSFVSSLERDDQFESQRVVLRKITARYPESRAAEKVDGIMRRLDRIGKPFHLDFVDAVGGSKVSMMELKGKVVVLDFWATWCGPCIADLPQMRALYAEYKNKGVEFIGISLDQQGELEKLKSFVKEKGVSWPQYYQGNGWTSEFSTTWGIDSIPAVFVLDREGNLASVNARGKLDTLIPDLLKKPVTRSTR